MSSIRLNIIASEYQVVCYRINPSLLDQAIVGISPLQKYGRTSNIVNLGFFCSDLIIVFLILDDNRTMSGLAN